jgi:hypothetical protein
MKTYEPLTKKISELPDGTEFGPINWLKGNNPIGLYWISHRKNNQMFLGHNDWSGSLLEWNLEAFDGYVNKMGWVMSTQELQYDPTQQGDTEEDI